MTTTMTTRLSTMEKLAKGVKLSAYPRLQSDNESDFQRSLSPTELNKGELTALLHAPVPHAEHYQHLSTLPVQQLFGGEPPSPELPPAPTLSASESFPLRDFVQEKLNQLNLVVASPSAASIKASPAERRLRGTTNTCGGGAGGAGGAVAPKTATAAPK